MRIPDLKLQNGLSVYNMNIEQLIDMSDLNNHDKTALRVLYRQYKTRLEHLPLETQLLELIHYFRCDHLVKRECIHCYIHNLIADYQVERFIQKHWKLDRNAKLKKIESQLRTLGLTGELRDLLHWNCSTCPFKQEKDGYQLSDRTVTMSHRRINLQYMLEQLKYKI